MSLISSFSQHQKLSYDASIPKPLAPLLSVILCISGNYSALHGGALGLDEVIFVNDFTIGSKNFALMTLEEKKNTSSEGLLHIHKINFVNTECTVFEGSFLTMATPLLCILPRRTLADRRI
jgi:hypothetical protein